MAFQVVTMTDAVAKVANGVPFIVKIDIEIVKIDIDGFEAICSPLMSGGSMMSIWS